MGVVLNDFRPGGGPGVIVATLVVWFLIIVVGWRLLRLACIYPLCVASEWGGFMYNSFVVKSGKVVKYPALITFVNVEILGENNDA